MLRQFFSVMNHSPEVKWIDSFFVVVNIIKHFPKKLTLSFPWNRLYTRALQLIGVYVWLLIVVANFKESSLTHN